MRKVIEEYYCDVCGDTANKNINTTVVFITEQTEGRDCEPYLDNKNIDICTSCLKEILKGKMLFGSGAQGYNSYWFKK